jgi:hypothetical protein
MKTEGKKSFNFHNDIPEKGDKEIKKSVCISNRPIPNFIWGSRDEYGTRYDLFCPFAEMPVQVNRKEQHRK